jgi:hypothetical protein
MDEKLNIKSLLNLNTEISYLNTQLELYEAEIKNEINDSKLEFLNKELYTLTNKRNEEIQLYIESIEDKIKNIGTNYGEDNLVYYSIEDRFIQIHRSNCHQYKNWIKGKDLKSKKCKSYKDAQNKAKLIIKEVLTDIQDGCTYCAPELNLNSILNSMNQKG